MRSDSSRAWSRASPGLAQHVDQTEVMGPGGVDRVAGEHQLHGHVERAASGAAGTDRRPPPPGDRFTSGTPNRAVVEATMRSQARMISVPPARAGPSTAAMMGLVRSRRVIPRIRPARCAGRRPAGVDLLEVGPGREHRRHAGEDADPEGVVSFELVDGVLDAVGHVSVDGVASLGPVDGDDGPVSFGGVLDGRSSPTYFGWRRAAPSMRMVSPFM